MNLRHPVLAFAVVLLLAVPATAQDDREIQVNTHTVGDQQAPRIESLADDRFLVVWQDADAPAAETDDDGTRVTGRFLDATGAPTGDAFQVNTSILGDQLAPRLARTSDDSLVVVWIGEQLAFRRFSSGGVAIGDDVAIPPIQTAGGVDVAPGTDGSFLVVWDCAPDCLGGSGSDIVAQRFDSGGNPASAARRVNAGPGISRDHVTPRVASLGANGFVVAWAVEAIPFTAMPQVRARRLDQLGVPFGPELELTVGLTLVELDVASNGIDRYALVGTGPGPSVQSPFEVRWFDATGSMLGSVATIDSTVGFANSAPSARMRADGTLDIVFGLGGTGVIIDPVLVRYDAARQLVETRPQMAATGGIQGRPASAENGSVRVVVWDSNESYGDDESGRSIQARTSFQLVFTDGFESGDALRWAERIGLR